MKELIERFKDKLLCDVETGCWNWTGDMRRAYGALRVDGRRIGAHRISYQLFRGPIPNGMQICHHCDNPRCCNPDHLFIGTPTTNMRDKMNKGRGFLPDVKGENHGNSKLNRSKVLEIRYLRSQNWRTIALAKRFGVSPSAICCVLSGRNWGWLK